MPVWNLVNAAAATVADAPSEDATQGSGRSPFGGMLPMLLIFFAIMYFLMIRPNQKREKERREMLSALAKGDRVVTSGGICGTVVGLNEKTVVLRVNEDGHKMEFVRGAVSKVMARGSENEG